MSGLDRILNAVGAILMALLVVLLLAQIAGRYLISAPWPWTEELARYVLIWVSFLGAWIAARQGAHFTASDPGRLFGGFGKWLAGVLSALAMAAVAYGGTILLPRVMGTGSPVLGISMSYVYAAVTVFCGLMAIDTLLLLARKETE